MDNREQKLPAADFAALVERAKAGDQDAFTALYEATNQEVYRTVRAMVRTDELALDIQQDAYVFAFTHLDQLGNPAKFRSWLRSIAANRTRSVLRKQTPVLFTELETEDGESFPELPDLSPESQPELSLERKETANLVREILDGLSDGQRLLVGMYYYEQIPVNRIAEDLGVSSGTVKTQLSRSRKKIEAAVKRLEKKGVKLFGLAPMPFLLALLKKAEPAAEAEQSVLAGSLAKAGVVTRSAAVHVGRSFFQTALGRVALGVITAGVIGGGVLGYGWVRDNLLTPIGDTQPPVSVESAEDLTTEPSETAEWESPEDLTTEPVTTEPTEPAATELTEPATTEPTERNTDPAVAADPGGHPEKPADPDDPTDPVTPSPGGAGSDPAPQPTDPQPSETAESSELISVFWTNDDSAEDLNYPWNAPNTKSYLCLIVKGDEVPTVFTDNMQMLQFDFWGHDPDSKTKEGYRIYYLTVTVKDYGTASIYCRLNGNNQKVKTITIERSEPKAVSYTWYGPNGEIIKNPSEVNVKPTPQSIGMLEIVFSGVEEKDLNKILSADNSACVSFHIEGTRKDENGNVAGQWSFLFPSDGTTTMTCKLNGNVLFSFQLHIQWETQTEPTESTEPTELTEPTEPTEPNEP